MLNFYEKIIAFELKVHVRYIKSLLQNLNLLLEQNNTNYSYKKVLGWMNAIEICVITKVPGIVVTIM